MKPRTYSGVVEKGEGRAARLGFPTANIPLSDASLSGVYAARVGVGGEAFPSVVFADQERGLLEAHLFDFSGDLYGTEVVIELYEKIRDTGRFESDADLSNAIREDARKAGEYFKKHPLE